MWAPEPQHRSQATCNARTGNKQAQPETRPHVPAARQLGLTAAGSCAKLGSWMRGGAPPPTPKGPQWPLAPSFSVGRGLRPLPPRTGRWVASGSHSHGQAPSSWTHSQPLMPTASCPQFHVHSLASSKSILGKNANLGAHGALYQTRTSYDGPLSLEGGTTPRHTEAVSLAAPAPSPGPLSWPTGQGNSH